MTTSVSMQYEASGGAVRIGKSLYVERAVDATFVDELARRRGVFIISAPRQSGKSSLWARTLDALKGQGFTFAAVDFRDAFGQPDEITSTANGWTETLLRALSRQFGQDLRAFDAWLKDNAGLSVTNRITAYFSDFLRPRLEGPLVVAFDEIDVVQPYHYFTDNFFEAIRILGQQRDRLDMSFVLIGVNKPEDLLKTAPQSAFNLVSQELTLRDFDPADDKTVADWASAWPDDGAGLNIAVARAALEATGGQPYLTACLLQEARVAKVVSLADFSALLQDRIARARDEDWKPAHFRAPRDVIVERSAIAYAILDGYVAAREAPLNAKRLKKEVRAALLASGLVHPDPRDEHLLVIKSPIYREVFDETWVKAVRDKVGGEVFAGEAMRFHVGAGEQRKRICILNTGGMISTELQPDGNVGIPPDLTRFFRKFPELNAIAEVTAVPLMAKDSSDMNPADWEVIAEAIFSRRFQGFDGFVVAHGTDTLPYTASAVAFALGEGLNFPVAFVGSQVGSHVFHGDARINLLRAATVATRPIPEVVAIGGDQIHRGVRVQKRDDFRFDGFHSPTWQPLGAISDDIDVRPGDIRVIDRRREMELRNRFSRGVFKISLYPGLRPEFLTPLLDNPHLEGIIIETLGIGIVPTEGDWSLIPFIRKATEKDIPVLLASQFPIQTRMAGKYQPARAARAAGAMAALNMSPPAAVTKFMWVLPQVLDKIASKALPADRKIAEVERMMATNYVGETTES